MDVPQINEEFYSGLEVVSNKIYPLIGGMVERSHFETDVRHGRSIGNPTSSVVTLYEHLATLRHRPSGTFFVCFRETMDALLARQKDPEKFPNWLMDHPAKQTELKIYIHLVTRNPHDAGVTTIADWLQELPEGPLILKGSGYPHAFESLVEFLIRNRVIEERMYGNTQ